MHCTKCGSIIEQNAIFCGNCGAPQNPQIDSGSLSKSFPHQESDTNPQVELVKSFFQNSFLGIIKSILTEPIKGTFHIFTNAKEEAYHHALILIFTTGIFYAVTLFLFMPKGLVEVSFGVFLKIGILIILILLIISTLTYLVKSISGKADFKRELLTGGICGIPLMISMAVFSILIMFSSPYSFSFENMMNQGIILIANYIYTYLMLINIVQQSLKSSETKDAISWYISPLLISLSFYLGISIAKHLFLPTFY